MPSFRFRSFAAAAAASWLLPNLRDAASCLVVVVVAHEYWINLPRVVLAFDASGRRFARADTQTDKRTNEQTDRQTDEQTDAHIQEQRKRRNHDEPRAADAPVMRCSRRAPL